MSSRPASALDPVSETLPDGMKAILAAPMGILENLIELLGFDTLCYWSVDDSELLHEISDRLGSLLFEYYRRVADHPAVGALIANDDLGLQDSDNDRSG